MRSVALVALGCTFLGACTYAQLSGRGRLVEVVDAAPQGCRNLGIVVGKGGGGGGEFVKNENLIVYAVNDARNKAGELGATHLTYSAPALGATSGSHGGTVTSATVTGIAYACAPGAPAPAGAQPLPQPAAPAQQPAALQPAALPPPAR